MSTYYFLCCAAHREYVDACSRIASGDVVHLANSNRCLPSFIYRHRACALAVQNEHDETRFNEKWTEWESTETTEIGCENLEHASMVIGADGLARCRDCGRTEVRRVERIEFTPRPSCPKCGGPTRLHGRELPSTGVFICERKGCGGVATATVAETY